MLSKHSLQLRIMLSRSFVLSGFVIIFFFLQFAETQSSAVKSIQSYVQTSTEEQKQMGNDQMQTLTSFASSFQSQSKADISEMTRVMQQMLQKFEENQVQYKLCLSELMKIRYFLLFKNNN